MSILRSKENVNTPHYEPALPHHIAVYWDNAQPVTVQRGSTMISLVDAKGRMIGQHALINRLIAFLKNAWAHADREYWVMEPRYVDGGLTPIEFRRAIVSAQRMTPFVRGGCNNANNVHWPESFVGNTAYEISNL